MKAIRIGGWLAFLAGLVVPGAARGQQPGATETSYLPVAVKESTRTIQERMEAAKPEVMDRQRQLLGDRYDLSDRPATGVKMSRGKPVQEGVRAKLPAGTTWEKLGGDDARRRSATRTSSRRASCRCRTRTTPRAAWSSRSPDRRDQAAGRAATSSGSTSTSTCPSTSCPSSRRRSS